MRPAHRERVILQPAGGIEATQHYLRTVKNPIRLSSIIAVLEKDAAEALAACYPTGWIRVWGVTPGSRGINRTKWLQFAKGDRVLFCGQNKVFASASVRYRLHNRRLALQLWGADKSGETWEYIYFVGDPREQGISYSRLAAAIQYSPTFVPLGVNILDHEKSAALLDAFDLTDD